MARGGEFLLGSGVGIEQSANRIVNHPLYLLFISVLLLLLLCSFAVLLNSLYPNPRVLPFSSNSPPCPTRGQEWVNSRVVLRSQLGLNHDNQAWTRCCHSSTHIYPTGLINTEVQTALCIPGSLEHQHSPSVHPTPLPVISGRKA